MLDFQLGSEYVSVSFFPGAFYILSGKEVLREMGELRNEFCENLVKFWQTNYSFYQKEVI